MSSIRLGWKLSVVVALLATILAFSFLMASVNGAPTYRVTFSQSGLDNSATGTVVTVDGSAKKYSDLSYRLDVNSGAKVSYTYEMNVSSSTSGKRFRLNTVSGPPSPITVTSATTVTGNYLLQYYLTVTSPYDTPGGQAWYDSGSMAYATLATGNVSGGTGIRYVFTGWSGAASGTGLKSNAITMNSAKTATANWKTQYYLTVISAHDSPAPASGWYDTGASVTASVTSPADESTGSVYTCTGWTGTGSVPTSGTNTKVTFKIDKSSSLTWNWKAQYYITVTSAHDGPTPSAYVDAGRNFTASVTSPTEIVPNDYQWVCTGFSVDGGAYQNGTNYTFTNVQAPHHIDFAWKQQSLKPKFLIQVNSSRGSPTPSQSIDPGGSLTVSVTSPADDDGAGTRYRCTGYKIDDGSLQAGTSYTFTNVQAVHKIEFQWTTQYELVMNTNPSGISAISGSGWYDDKTVVTTGTAPTTVTSGSVVYTFSTWKKDGVAVSGNPINIIMDAPHSAIAYYTSPTPPETGNLYIYVKDSNNNPISGATVQSASQPSGQSQLTGTTDTNGYIAFDNILTGSYAVEAFKSGYITSTKSVTVTSDQRTTETIQLKPSETGDLLIVVRDSNNNPVIGANVTSTSQPFGATTLKGVTNSSGYAKFFNIVSGAYFIQVSKTDYDTASKQVTVEAQKTTTSTVVFQNQSPAKITINSPTEITENSVKLIWSQSTEADFARYEIYQSTSFGHGLADLGTKIYAITDKSTTSYIVTGLSSNIKYYFTVRVVIAGNLYADSEQVSAQTKMISSPSTTEAVPLWAYIAGLLVLWVVTITILVLVVRADRQNPKDEASKLKT